MKKHHSRKCTSKSSALLKIQNRGGVTGEPDFGCGERAVCSQRVYCARERDVSRDRLMSKEGKTVAFLRGGTLCSCASGSSEPASLAFHSD